MSDITENNTESAITHSADETLQTQVLPAFAVSGVTAASSANDVAAPQNTNTTSDVTDDAATPPEFYDNEEEIQPPFPQKNARELKRLPPDIFKQKNPSKKSFDFRFGWGAKIVGVLMAVIFAAAAGFLVAGLIWEHSPTVVNSREHHREVLAQKQATLEDETALLEQEKRRLELNKELLEAKKKNLEREESRLAGKHEQLYAEETDSSSGFISRLLDKVTGRREERREEIYRTEQEKAATTKSGDEVDKALRDAQATLDSVNEKLDDARAMKRDIDAVRSQIEAAYAENKDVADAIIYYTKAGATVMLNIFSGHTNDIYDEDDNEQN